MSNMMKMPAVPLTMTSREIADLTGKRHDNVAADIRNMLEELGFDVLKFQGIYLDSRNRQQVEFHLTRELTDTLLTGYSAKLRLAVVRRWHELEVKQTPAELSRLEILQIAIDSEQARIAAEAQRDEAIRTKALIGSKREASAMGKASAAIRQVNRLTEELGRNMRHATVIAVEKALGRKLGKQDWRPLRKFCQEKGLPAEKVTDPRYGEVKAWPADAWRSVYGIDLGALFTPRGDA